MIKILHIQGETFKQFDKRIRKNPQVNNLLNNKNPNAVALGKLGGSKTSPKKKLSSKKNGKKGGRPKTLKELIG